MAGADADHDVVGFVVGAVEEVDVVGGDGLEIELLGEFEEGGGDAVLCFEAVVVDFDEGVLLAVDVAEFGEGVEGFVFVAGEDPFVDGAGDAAGEADDAF